MFVIALQLHCYRKFIPHDITTSHTVGPLARTKISFKNHSSNDVFRWHGVIIGKSTQPILVMENGKDPDEMSQNAVFHWC